MQKKNKSLLIFIAIFIIITSSITTFVVFKELNRVKYDSELKDLSWPNGDILIEVSSKTNQDNEFDNHIVSTNNKVKIKTKFEDDNLFIFLSPQEILFYGKFYDAEKEYEKGFYYINTDGFNKIKSRQKDDQVSIYNMSFSSSKKYLRYLELDSQEQERLCVTRVDLKNKIGDCLDINIKANMPENLDFGNDYYVDGDWLKNEDRYIFNVISHSEPDKVIKRLSFNPENEEMKEINLKEPIILKTKELNRDEDREDFFEYFNKAKGDYEIIENYRNQSVGILEKSTSKKAKLANIPLSGAILLYEINFYTKD